MNDVQAKFDRHRAALVRDVNELLNDAQGLLRASADEAGEDVQRTREQVLSRLHAARARLDHLQERGELRLREWAADGDLYVREHPWRSIGAAATVAAGIGLVVGALLSRR